MNSPNGRYTVDAAQIVGDEKIHLMPGMESKEKDGAETGMPVFSKAGQTRFDREGNRYIKAGNKWLKVATLMSKAKVKQSFEDRKEEIIELDEGTVIALVTPEAVKQMKAVKESKPTKSRGNSR